MPKFKNGTNQKALSNVTKPINHCSFTFSDLYDANGNQYADFNKGIAWIQFNSLNLPRKIQFGNGNKAEYFYDATGVKYKAQWGYAATPQNIPLVATGTEYLSPTGGMRTEYCGNYVYENGILRKIITLEGYVVTNSNNNLSEAIIKISWWHCYFLKDHMGNTRRTLRGSQMKTGETTLYIYSDIIDYYPFGLEITRVTNPEGEDYSPPYLAGATTPYLYNGKEIDRMHGLNWYDYGARYYDGSTGRWHGVDPLAEKYYSISPYAYVANNPIMFIDPDGRDIVLPIGTTIKDTYTILGNLQKLTNDKLVYSTQKDRTIKIKIASLAKSGTEDKVTGTNLIRALNSSDKNVTLMIQAGRNDATSENRIDAQNGVGTNSTVRIDPSVNVDLRVDNGQGGTMYETAPAQVILGHELIHAKDHMEGTLNTNKANHSYKRLDGTTKVERHKIAEYRAVGFKGFVGKDGISENSIRKEQGEKQRTSYEVYPNKSN